MEAVATLIVGALLGWLPAHAYYERRCRQLEQSGARRSLRRVREIVLAAQGVDGKVQLAPAEAGEVIGAIEQTVQVDTVLRIPGG
jgi:hypothetical protein